MADMMKTAAELCGKDSRTEQKQYGQLLPCRKISPLEPFIKLEEYFMLERDTGKYLLYMTAIERATEDILNSSHNIKKLKCLVLGPGLGRLVRFCIEAAKHFEVDVSVHVLEANPVAVEFLRKSFVKEIDDKIVHLYEPFTFHPKLRICDLPSDLQEHCGSFDIIASELLGCFGDDEFLPELTSTLYKVFSKPETGIMIPDTWTNYLVPVSCPTTYNYLTTSKKSLEAGYTMGLPKDCTFLSNTKAAWTGDCQNSDMKYSCDLDFSLDLKDWTSAEALENDQAVTHLSETFSKKSVEQSQLQESSANSGCYGNSKSCQLVDLSDSRCHSNINSFQEEDLSANSGCHGNNSSLQSEHDSKHFSSIDKLQLQDHDKIKGINYAVVKDIKDRESDTDTEHETKKKTLEILRQTDTHIHGFIGYFTSVLYKDIIIDTRHTSGHRNSFHWECYFIPLPKPVLVEPGTRVRLRMNRNCEEYLKDGLCIGLKLWYEWQVLVQQDNDLDSSNVSEYEHKLEDKKAKSNNKPANPVFLHQDKHSDPKTSKKSDTEDSSSEEVEFCKERGRQRSMHKLSVQNRNGELDAVFLTWQQK